MSDADLHLLTGAYALDALDDVERVAFERHLASCQPCVDEVAGLRDVAARLGAAESVPPSAESRASTLAAAARTPQVRPPARVTRAADDTADDGVDEGADAPRRGGVGWWALAASVAAALAIGSAVTAVQQDRRADRLEAQVASVADVLGAPDAVRVTAASTAEGVTGSVVVSPQQGAAVVVGDGFAATTGDQTLQVWVIDGGKAVPSGTLRRSADGAAIGLVDGAVGPGATVAVTLEPTSTATAPSTDPLLAAEV
jgi:hypothetical protein